MANPFRLSRAVAAAGTVCFWAHTAFAYSIFTVGPAADCPFSTIQAAVDAARDTPGVDYVWISNDLVSGTRHDYTGEHVFVNDVDGVIIEGGFVSCADPDIDPADYTTISGAGNDGGPVFDISSAGGDVFLGNLYITGANRDDGASGGGISFTGEVGGALLLSNATVALNRAGYGGGINVDGTNAPAAIVLEQNSLILNNTASTSGGGIRVEGNTRLYVLQPSTLIGYNHALGGYGGGIEVLGPARADIGSPGYLGGAVLQFNDAQYGGGIAVIAEIGDGDLASVRLFTTDPLNPVQIANNSAAATGGGIYLKPAAQYPDFPAFPSLCAYDFRIHDNLAQEGTAIYADTDSDVSGTVVGAYVYLAPVSDAGSFFECHEPEPPAALGAVACNGSAPCNTIDDNVAEDTSGQPTAGSTILMQSAGTLFAHAVSARGNQGAHVLRVLNDNAEGDSTDLFDVLFADNVTSEELVLTDGDNSGPYPIAIVSSTFANNQVGAPYAFLLRGDVEFDDNIVDEPGRATIDFGGGGTLDVAYVLSNDTTTLSGPGVMEGEPTFVDAAHGDYRLQRTSLGVDYAPATGSIDLDRQPRNVDLPDVPNAYGPLDLGAYEIQGGTLAGCSATDTIFCNGFEN